MKNILLVRATPNDLDINAYNVQQVGIGKSFVNKGFNYDFITFKKDAPRKETVFYEKDGCRAKCIELPRKRFLRWGINTEICDEDFLDKYDLIICQEYYQLQTYLMSCKSDKVVMYTGPYYNMFMPKFLSPIYDFSLTKKLNRQSVILFLVLNGICFTIFAFLLNPLAGACAVPVFLALLFYSYWKRFSFLCHWYLGFAIGMSPLGAWIAVRGEFAIFPIFLMFILMLWMGGFDIIYATQDEAIDKELGLHSVPARFGRKKALQIALGSHIAMLALALFFGLYWQMGIAWWVVFSLMSLAILYIHLFRKSDDLDSLNRDFFLANVGVSVLVMLGLIFWVIFGGSALG